MKLPGYCGGGDTVRELSEREIKAIAVRAGKVVQEALKSKATVNVNLSEHQVDNVRLNIGALIVEKVIGEEWEEIRDE